MKDKIMNLVELDTMSRNVSMLEARLGYPVPRHLLNSDDLKKDIMSLEEVDTTARNIDLLNTVRGNKVKGNDLPLLIECWPIALAAAWILLVLLFGGI